MGTLRAPPFSGYPGTLKQALKNQRVSLDFAENFVGTLEDPRAPPKKKKFYFTLSGYPATIANFCTNKYLALKKSKRVSLDFAQIFCRDFWGP